jgi:hypothetical protein
MKPWELYEEIKKTKYTKSGDSVDWAVKVYPDEKLIRLLFEESTEDRDWRNNFDFPIKPYKQQDNTLWFARGWGNAYKSCNDEIMEKLTKTFYELKDQSYTVEVCGWSYGGAMALLAAEDFCYRTGYLPGVVTFGAPKPLWGRKTKKYVASCLAYCFQYAHVNDFVPVCIPLPGYRMVNKVKVGKDFCILKYFKTGEYHCSYGDKSLYE